MSAEDLTACLPATVADLVRETGRDYATILAAIRRLKAQRRVTTETNGRTVLWKEA